MDPLPPGGSSTECLPVAPEQWLHEHPDFEALVRIVSDRLSIVPQLVEKDYWIMHCLWGIKRQFSFELKGGTSLSKGFNIIDRFSEDLDVRIEPPAELDVKTGRNHNKPPHIASRRNYYAWLVQTIDIPGILSVDRDTAFDDKYLRSAGIRLRYEGRFSGLAGIRDGVLLEVGFDDTAPNEERTISSWAFDHALGRSVPFADNRAKGIKCYSPAYTFVEKLQTVSTKFRRQQENGSSPADFLRHYYDVYRLLDRPEVQEFIGTPDYEKRKLERFRTEDTLSIAENEAFVLRDPQIRRYYEAEYSKTASLYYAGQAPFSEILHKIAENIHRL